MFCLLLALMVLLSGCMVPPQFNRSGEKLPIAYTWTDLDYVSMERRTIKINQYCDGTYDGWGSGVVIGDGIVATAKHVVDDDPEDCYYSVHEQRSIEVVPHKVADVALVYFSPGHFSAYTVLSNPYLGQPVVSIGYPSDKRKSNKSWLSVTRGNVASHYPGQALFRFTAQVLPGSSGGPVFSEEGYLLGIVSRYWRAWGIRGSVIPIDGHYYAVPSRYINDLLR